MTPKSRMPILILQNVSTSVIPLDVLNNLYQPLARYDARLLDLHGDWATLTLPADASVSCLHWGSLVRFTFSDGPYRCEAEGIVVAHRASEDGEMSLKSDGDTTAQTSTLELRSPCREITVQLWQCQQKEERRLGPRRWSRIAVLLRPEREAHPSPYVPRAALEEAAEECWESGWAVDLSANGMRLRTHVSLPLKQRIALQFALPIAPDSSHVSNHFESSTPLLEPLSQLTSEEPLLSRRRFLLTGRVLRSERTRAASSHQAMICFEQLTAAEGLALSRFLAG